jgi:hypothetical protein
MITITLIMVIKWLVRRLINFGEKVKKWAEEEEGEKGGKEEKGVSLERRVHSLWDYIKINENTQAHHILSVLGYEEYIDMEEILRRIEDVFGVRYKNKRSLYPYVKTLVDLNLVECVGTGGRRRWRKKELIFEVIMEKKPKKKKKVEEIETITVQ